MNKKWLLIDFDNTLMATEQYTVPSLVARFNELYGSQLNHLLTLAEFKQHFHGQARETLCENLSRYFNIQVDYSKLYDLREWRIMQHYQKLPQGIEMAPMVIEVLTHFATQHVGLALVTNNPLQRAFAAMRYASNKKGKDLAKLFSINYFESGDMQKPKPDVYLQAMAQVNAEPSQCFAIEDSITGATSAIQAKLNTFGFTGFADNPAELTNQLITAGCCNVFHEWSHFQILFQKIISQ